jgi:GST-like protein
MIDLYTWTTPNGRKASIMLEELGLAYTVKPVNIGKDEQFSAEFLKIAPNNKIPAIVDHDAPGGSLAIFESGAILTYLAEKTGQLLAPSGAARYKALEWTYWQVGGLGPMLGQLGFFLMRSKDKPPEAIERFTTESARLFGVMEKRLAEVPYLAGEDYSIADVACYAWTFAASGMIRQAAPAAWGDNPSIERWLKAVGERPAVQRGMAIPKV